MVVDIVGQVNERIKLKQGVIAELPALAGPGWQFVDSNLA